MLVGHSERRQYHNETNEIVNSKAKRVFENSMIPIVCVGEGLEVRQAGNHVAYTLEQVGGSVAGMSADEVAKLVIAYEPVWAIGTGEVATPEDAQEVCNAIRSHLAENWSPEAAEQTRILYGGSVKATNVSSIMAKKDVDGALVGGASLDAEEFAGIARFYDLLNLN